MYGFFFFIETHLNRDDLLIKKKKKIDNIASGSPLTSWLKQISQTLGAGSTQITFTQTMPNVWMEIRRQSHSANDKCALNHFPPSTELCNASH